jgi:hypothetical protein
LYVSEIHSCSTPNFDEISSYGSNLVKVSSHLVVEQCKPISNPELENTSSLGDSVNVDSFHDTLGNVHTS